MSTAKIQSHEARASLLGGQSSDWAYQPHSGAHHHRKGYPAASAGGRQAKRTMYRPNSFWTWALVVVTAVQAAIVLAFESYVFVKFQKNLHNAAQNPYSRAIPTSLTLYIFGFLYQLVLVFDALRLQNTIQVIGLCLFNIALLVYASVQMTQIYDAVIRLHDQDQINLAVWEGLKPYLTAVPCIIALGFILMSVVAWKLYDEFAWMIYKHISADLRMKRRYLNFQIYITLLKFDFFFFLGFTIQFVVIVVYKNYKSNVEFYLTIAAIPVTIVILFMAAFFTRRENRLGMVAIILLYLAGLAYFLFKLVRMWHSNKMEQYAPVRKSMTAFAIITIILILITIANACVCTANFGKGLKPHLAARKLGSESEDEKTDITEMPNLSHGGPVPSRMTID